MERKLYPVYSILVVLDYSCIYQHTKYQQSLRRLDDPNKLPSGIRYIFKDFRYNYCRLLETSFGEDEWQKGHDFGNTEIVFKFCLPYSINLNVRLVDFNMAPSLKLIAYQWLLRDEREFMVVKLIILTKYDNMDLKLLYSKEKIQKHVFKLENFPIFSYRALCLIKIKKQF